MAIIGQPSRPLLGYVTSRQRGGRRLLRNTQKRRFLENLPLYDIVGVVNLQKNIFEREQCNGSEVFAVLSSIVFVLSRQLVPTGRHGIARLRSSCRLPSGGRSSAGDITLRGRNSLVVMAEGTYFDPYVAMDATGGMIPPINGYRTQAMDHYGMFFVGKIDVRPQYLVRVFALSPCYVTGRNEMRATWLTSSNDCQVKCITLCFTLGNSPYIIQPNSVCQLSKSRRCPVVVLDCSVHTQAVFSLFSSPDFSRKIPIGLQLLS